MKHLFGHLCFLLPIVAIVSCGEGPQIVFPQEDQIARITGNVQPRQSGATVYLEDVEIIDSTIIDSSTGRFTFDSVRYGDYRLRVKATGYGVYTSRIALDDRYYSVSTIYLDNQPSQIYYVFPYPDQVIGSSSIRSDDERFTEPMAVIFLYFKEPMDSLSVAQALTITPAVRYTFGSWVATSSYYYTQLFIPVTDFFAHGRISFTIDTTARTLYGERLDFRYTFSYSPDTSNLTITRIKQFIGTVYPRDSSTLMNTTDSVRIIFSASMNKASIEQRLSLTPSTLFSVSWDTVGSVSRMTIVPSQPMRADTNYVVAIDSGFQTMGGSAGIAFSMGFVTRPLALSFCTPMNGQVSVSRTDTLFLTFNTAVDVATVLDHVSIIPAVDSLAVALPNPVAPASSIALTHAPYMADILYTVTLDSVLSDVYGKTMGKTVTLSFRTGT
jgi:hypothetical protein